MISLLWTKSNTIGSKAIRDITESKSSHMAWMLDEHLIFHANHKGCHVEWIQRFLNKNQIVYRIDLDLLTLQGEEKLYLELIKYDGQPYDYPALWYNALSWIAYRLKLMPRRTANRWGSNHKHICIELARPLETMQIELPELDMITPDELYLYLKSALHRNLTTNSWSCDPINK